MSHNFFHFRNFSVIFLLLIVCGIGFSAVSFSEAYAHKLILTDGTNSDFESALEIPDHKISWAIYQDLEKSATKFYFFEGEKGESLYASIVVPKMEKLKYFSPSLVLVGPGLTIDNSKDALPFELTPGLGAVTFDYNGPIPSSEFYEPFGQVTYWERQEIEVNLPESGVFYLVIYENNQISGKYSLAVGKIEDFSIIDFFYLLPISWFETKLFFEDYLSAFLPLIILVAIPLIILYFKIRRKKIPKLV